MNITKDGIICYTRSEIVAAHDYIKNVLKRRTVIKLAAPFLPWTESAITIDVSYVSIDGSFVELDATKATTSSGPPPVRPAEYLPTSADYTNYIRLTISLTNLVGTPDNPASIKITPLIQKIENIYDRNWHASN